MHQKIMVSPAPPLKLSLNVGSHNDLEFSNVTKCFEWKQKKWRNEKNENPQKIKYRKPS